jgi:hypothetical protein
MSTNNYYKKYLKYKQKYLELKKQLGGDCPIGNYKGKPDNFFTDPGHYSEDECIVNTMVKKLDPNSGPQTFTKDEVTTYLRALQGFHNKNYLCASAATSNQSKKQCAANLANFKKWRTWMYQRWNNQIQGVNSLNTLIEHESPNFYKLTI